MSAEPVERRFTQPASSGAQFELVTLPAGGRAVMGFRRWQSFDQDNLPGQDAAGLYTGGNHVVGVVADGVGGSYRPEIAAENVRRCLLEILWEARAEPPGQEAMSRRLLQLAEQVQEEINPLKDEDESSWIGKAKAAKRKKGSQAVFAAFVFDQEKGTAHLYRVGDPSAVIYFRDRSAEVLESRYPLSLGRWSSLNNADLQLQIDEFQGVVGCLICSDGVPLEWGGQLEGLPDSEQFEGLAAKHSADDDMSLVAVRCEERAEGTVEPATGSVAEAAVASRTEEEDRASQAAPHSLEIREPPEGRGTSWLGSLAVRCRLPRLAGRRLAAVTRYAAMFLAGTATGWACAREGQGAVRHDERSGALSGRVSRAPAADPSPARQPPRPAPSREADITRGGRLVVQIKANRRQAEPARESSCSIDSGKLQRAEVSSGRLRLSLVQGEIKILPSVLFPRRRRGRVVVRTVAADGTKSVRTLRLEQPVVLISVK